jgi:hypothetical protein
VVAVVLTRSGGGVGTGGTQVVAVVLARCGDNGSMVSLLLSLLLHLQPPQTSPNLPKAPITNQLNPPKKPTSLQNLLGNLT